MEAKTTNKRPIKSVAIMKKTLKRIGIATVCILLSAILGFATYLFVWGGKPRIENFDEISADYEIVANLALEYYDELSNEYERITITTKEDHLFIDTTDTKIDLNERQLAALETVNKRFDFGFLRVTKDTVFFCRDETWYYGLVYSKNPLLALYKSDLLKRGRTYHRISSRWYEWGAWGI